MRSRWRAWRLRDARERLEDLRYERGYSMRGMHPSERRYYEKREAKLLALIARLAGEARNR